MLRPHISEKFNGQVWRLEIDETTGILCAEIRNTADKQLSFASMDMETGACYFKNLTTPERWLTGMETVHNGILLLHHYQSEDSPAHRALIAVDARKGNIIWQNYNYAFDHLSAAGPVVYDTRIQPKKLFIIDILSGQQLRAYNPVVDASSQNQIELPEMALVDETDLLPSHLKVYGNIIHRLNYNNYRIVSLHTFDEDVLKQHLFVFYGANNEPVFDDLLNSEIQKMQPEAFMLSGDRLIWIKDKSEIKVLNLKREL